MWAEQLDYPETIVARKIECVVLDLDNTLWDWVDVWYKSFKAMYDEIVRISELDPEVVADGIQEVFRRHQTSEYAFVIEELQPLNDHHGPDVDLRELYDSAVEAYRNARAEALAVYPGVAEVLTHLKTSGTLLVGYTESMVVYTSHRLARLGLDGVLDYLYAPEDHQIPADLDPSRLTDNDLSLNETEVRHTPAGQLKPAPDILLGILDEVGVDPGRAIYVGDSQMKDVAMAAQAGVFSVHAAYGEAQDRPEYKLLQRVSHWTDADIERETLIRAAPAHEPNATLQEGIWEILSLGTFGVDDVLAHEIDVWKKTVDVQMHFNDIELKIRNFAITILAAVLGASAVAVREDAQIGLGDWITSLASWILAGGLIAWIAFWFVDHVWYHQLLLGSVIHAEKIERRLSRRVPALSLSSSIRESSHFDLLGLFRGRGEDGQRNRHESGFFVLNSSQKMVAYYWTVGILLVALGVVAHIHVNSANVTESDDVTEVRILD